MYTICKNINDFCIHENCRFFFEAVVVCSGGEQAVADLHSKILKNRITLKKLPVIYLPMFAIVIPICATEMKMNCFSPTQSR